MTGAEWSGNDVTLAGDVDHEKMRKSMATRIPFWKLVIPTLGAIAVAETLTLGELLLERRTKPVATSRPVAEAVDPMQTGSIEATDGIGRLIARANLIQPSLSGESKHSNVHTIEELLKRMTE